MYQAPHVFALIMFLSSFIHPLRTVVQENICSQEHFQNVKMWRALMQAGMYVFEQQFFKVVLRLRIQMRENTIRNIKMSVKKKSKAQQNLEIPQIMFPYNTTIPDRSLISFLF